MKPIYRFDIEQNSDEWYDIKVGTYGASSATSLLMAENTVGYQKLKDRLVEERITKVKEEGGGFKGNKYTERGHEFEPIAREDYEYRTFTNVEIIGVIEYDDFIIFSPDGLIADDKLHQIKCPIFNTQKKYLKLMEKHKDLSDNDKLKKIDGGYYKQCQFELFGSRRKQNIWTSFHPNLPPIDLTLERDEPLIAEIKTKSDKLKEEVLAEINYISLISKL